MPNFLVGHKAFGAKKYSLFSFNRGWNMLRLDQPQPVHGGTKVKQEVYKEHCNPLKFSCFNTYKQAGLLKVFLEHLKTLTTFAILFWTLETDGKWAAVSLRVIYNSTKWQLLENGGKLEMCRSLNSETPVRAELNQFLLLSLFFFLDRVAFFVPSRANQTVTGCHISKLIAQIFAAGFVGWLPSTCVQNLRVKLSTSTWMQMIMRVKWIDTSKS